MRGNSNTDVQVSKYTTIVQNHTTSHPQSPPTYMQSIRYDFAASGLCLSPNQAAVLRGGAACADADCIAHRHCTRGLPSHQVVAEEDGVLPGLDSCTCTSVVRENKTCQAKVLSMCAQVDLV